MKNLLVNKSALPHSEIINVEPVPLNRYTDPHYYARLGWWIIVVGVGGFFLWALIAPLDQGEAVNGMVIVASNRQEIQYQPGGTIESILVKDGQKVKAGQPLVLMNKVQAKAQDDMTRVQYFTTLATQARLLAERDGKRTFAFPLALEKWKTDPDVSAAVDLQQELLTSRRLGLQSALAEIDANSSGLKQQLSGMQDALASKKIQDELLKEQVDSLRDLTKEGYVSHNRLLDIERTYAQIQGSMAEDMGNIGRIKLQIVQLGQQRAQRLEDYQKEVRTQLSDVERDSQALASRLNSQDYDLANTVVRSPVSGTVVGLNVFTNGGVVSPGFRMMDVVPNNQPLIVEGRLPVNLIDKVRPGLPVDMMFTAFNQSKTPHVMGKVTMISADRLVDEKTGMPYYQIDAVVTPGGMKKIANLQVRPGMPVEMFVKTGERTMMNYLMKPIMDNLKTSMPGS